MARISHLNPLDFPALIASFELELAALNRSKSTRRIYLSSLDKFVQWLEVKGHPPGLDRGLVQAWMKELLDKGAEPTTVAARLAGLRQFTKWAAKEGEIPTDPLLGLNAPKAPMKVTPVLTEAQLKALIQACQGPEIRDRRDEALFRLMAETGMRIGEVAALELDDIDLKRGLVTIRKSKNGRGRMVPLGPKTGRAIDRYLRARRQHPGAQGKAVWLGARTLGGLTPHGIRCALGERARLAGVPNFHPHVLRHTAASRWLSAGGSETSLLAVAGWTDRSMLDRYGAATKAERAAEESKRLNLGDY